MAQHSPVDPPGQPAGPTPPDQRVVGPLMFWHAARLEQIAPALMLADPDAAARALTGAARLYGVDLLPALPLELPALAVRSAVQPGAPLMALQQQQLAEQPVTEVGDPELVAESPAVVHAIAVVQRLVTLVPSGTRVAVPVPTPATLADQLGGHADTGALDAVISAYLRSVCPAEPAAVIHIGKGERTGTTESICAFFGVELLEATGDESETVSAPTGAEFTAVAGDLRTRVITTRTELPADAAPAAIAEAIQTIRRGGTSTS